VHDCALQLPHILVIIVTRNSSGDEIANANFLYDDIVHVLGNKNEKKKYTVKQSLNSPQ